MSLADRDPVCDHMEDKTGVFVIDSDPISAVKDTGISLPRGRQDKSLCRLTHVTPFLPRREQNKSL